MATRWSILDTVVCEIIAICPYSIIELWELLYKLYFQEHLYVEVKW